MRPDKRLMDELAHPEKARRYERRCPFCQKLRCRFEQTTYEAGCLTWSRNYRCLRCERTVTVRYEKRTASQNCDQGKAVRVSY